MSDAALLSGLGLGAGAALASFIAGFAAYRILLRGGVVDRPNARSSHVRPTARGGGIAILSVWCAMVALHDGSLQTRVWLAAVLLLATVSFIDDLRSVPARWRFLCHAVAAGVLVWLSLPVLSAPVFGDGSVLGQVLGMTVAFCWLTGYTNAFNFMDGINGLSAGQAVVTSVGMAWLAGSATGRWDAPAIGFSLLLGGAALGFLPHNFPSARMFMGDVGSASIGFILATLVLWLGADAGWALWVPLLLLHANYVLDTGITLTRRVLAGARWYEPHREHFYQRLIRAGKSHATVTSVEMGLQVVAVVLLSFYFHASPGARIALVVAVLLQWVFFFLWAERCFRRSAGSAKIS